MHTFSKIFCWTRFWQPEKVFKLYLEDIVNISKRNSNNIAKTKETKKSLKNVSLMIIIFFAKLLQFISLLFCQNNTFYRFITYDVIFFLDCPSSMILFSISFGAQLIYYFYRGYFVSDNLKQVFPMLLIYKLFYQNFDGYFLNNYKTSKKTNKTTKWSILLKKYLKIAQWLYQSFFIFIGNFVIFKLFYVF